MKKSIPHSANWPDCPSTRQLARRPDNPQSTTAIASFPHVRSLCDFRHDVFRRLIAPTVPVAPVSCPCCPAVQFSPATFADDLLSFHDSRPLAQPVLGAICRVLAVSSSTELCSARRLSQTQCCDVLAQIRGEEFRRRYSAPSSPPTMAALRAARSCLRLVSTKNTMP